MSKNQDFESVLEVHGIWIDVDAVQSDGTKKPQKRILNGIAFPRYDEEGNRVKNEWNLQGFCLLKHEKSGKSFFEVRRNPRNGFFDAAPVIGDFDEHYITEKAVKKSDAPRAYLIYYPTHQDVNAPQGHVCSMTLAAQQPHNIVIPPCADSELTINNLGDEDTLVLDFDHDTEGTLHVLPMKRPNVFGKQRSKLELPNGQRIIVNGLAPHKLRQHIIFYDDFLVAKEAQKQDTHEENTSLIDRIQNAAKDLSQYASSKYAAAAAYFTATAAAAATVTQDSLGRKTYNFDKDLNSANATTVINAATSVASESMIIIDGQVFEGNAIPRRGVANVWSLNGYDLTRDASNLVITKSGIPYTSANRIEIANYPFGSNGENCGISLGMSAQSALHSAGSMVVQNLGPILPINDRRGVFATFEKVIENNKIVFYFVTRNRSGMELPYNKQDGQIVARYKLAEIDNNSGYAIAGSAQTAVANDGTICVIFAVNKIARNAQGQISAGSTSELKVAAIKPGSDIAITNLASSNYAVNNDADGRTFNPSNIVVNEDASRLIATYTQTAIGGAQAMAYREFDTNGQAVGEAVQTNEPSGFGAQSFPTQITLNTGHTVRANRISGMQTSLSFNPPNLVTALNNTFDNLVDPTLAENVIPASNCSISLPAQGSENTEIIIPALANSRMVINANDVPFRLNLSNLGISYSQILRYLREAREDEILPQDYLARGAIVAVPNIIALTKNVTDAPQNEIAPRFAVLDLPGNQKIIINGLSGSQFAMNATQYIVNQELPTPSSVLPELSLRPSSLLASSSALSAISSRTNSSMQASSQVSNMASPTNSSSYHVDLPSTFTQPTLSNSGPSSIYSSSSEDHFSDEYYSSPEFSFPSDILSSSQIQALLTPSPTQPSVSVLDSLAHTVEEISSSLPQEILSSAPDFSASRLTSSIYSILESSSPALEASEILSQADSQSQEITSLITSSISSRNLTASQALSTLTQIISAVAQETQSLIESLGATTAAASLQMMSSSSWPAPTAIPTSSLSSSALAGYSSDIFSPTPTAIPNPVAHDESSSVGLDNAAIGGIVAAAAVSTLFALYCCYKKVKQKARVSDSANESMMMSSGGNEGEGRSVSLTQETSLAQNPLPVENLAEVRTGKRLKPVTLPQLTRKATQLGWRNDGSEQEPLDTNQQSDTIRAASGLSATFGRPLSPNLSSQQSKA